ncbi:hypothetical protein HPCU_00995 [Helicobacter pylori Cuz20]|uniref:Uncharacterized protein n=1 Tax=Helicobacter pylori (strain Cuz20) TaxID=765964 RepID=A0AB32X6S6_HELPC|nr:hypothetical protein [Helicobacter pylori]ADO03383.1 hypothetical protein HPCU_00995 [Helicobacter pylori Cuz20]
MDLKGLENALNNGDFKEQVTSSLEGIYQISKVLNQLDLLKNFSDHDLEIVEKIQTIKNALSSYETIEQELKAKIDALVSSLETRKQELEARLNTELQSVRTSEIQKLNETGSELKNNLINELKEAKIHLAQELEQLKASAQSLRPQIQGVTKFLGIYVYGEQSFFKNESDKFIELFEFSNFNLKANRSYIVEFSMPFELQTNGIYSESMGEMILCLKADNSVYPIINSFYQNKTSNLSVGNKLADTYRTTCIFKIPSVKVDCKIAVFARKHKNLWINVNYTSNTKGFEVSFLNNASFSSDSLFSSDFTTKSLPTEYNNEMVFYKHSQALIYEIL